MKSPDFFEEIVFISFRGEKYYFVISISSKLRLCKIFNFTVIEFLLLVIRRTDADSIALASARLTLNATPSPRNQLVSCGEYKKTLG